MEEELRKDSKKKKKKEALPVADPKPLNLSYEPFKCAVCEQGICVHWLQKFKFTIKSFSYTIISYYNSIQNI